MPLLTHQTKHPVACGDSSRAVKVLSFDIEESGGLYIVRHPLPTNQRHVDITSSLCEVDRTRQALYRSGAGQAGRKSACHFAAQEENAGALQVIDADQEHRA